MVQLKKPRVIVLLVCFAPLILLFSPLIAVVMFLVLMANVVRASERSPIKFLKLIRLLVAEGVFLYTAIPLYAPSTCRYLLNCEYKARFTQSERLDRPTPRPTPRAPTATEENDEDEGVAAPPSRQIVNRSFDSDIGVPAFPRMKKGIPYEVLVEGSIATVYSHPLQHYCKLDVYPCSIGSTPPITPGQSFHNAPVMKSLSQPWRRPVILFVYGGGFSSGGRWQYWKLANQLREQTNAMVVVPDYPTYPSGSVLEMAESVARALVWTYENCEKYGGSRSHVWMVAHSAGAHLSAYVVLRSMMAKASESNELPSTLLARKEVEIPIDPFSIRRVQYEGAGAHRMVDHKKISSTSSPATTTSSSSSPRRRRDRTRPSSNNPLGGTIDPSRPAVDFRRVPVPRGLVLFSGVYDLYSHRWWEEERGVRLLSALSAATGGQYDAVSPLQLLNAINSDPTGFPITREMCPPKGFRLVHSQSDHVVSVEQSLALKRGLEDLENTTTYAAAGSSTSKTLRQQQQHPATGNGGSERGSSSGMDDDKRPEEIAMSSLVGGGPPHTTTPNSSASTTITSAASSSNSLAEQDELLTVRNQQQQGGSSLPSSLPIMCPNGVQEFVTGGHASVVTGPMQHPEAAMNHHETVVHIVNALYGH